jgi:hypothetical protein
MMFRHHKDPLYYDTQANSKIFVPVDTLENLDDKQRAIVDTFPEEDRGMILQDQEYIKRGYGVKT